MESPWLPSGLLLPQLPVRLLWDLLYWPHLHISNLVTQMKEIDTKTSRHTTRIPLTVKKWERKTQSEIPGREQGHWGQMWQRWLCLRLSNTEKWRKAGIIGATICWYFHYVKSVKTCALTFILSYTAAAFSGSLLWCRKANSVSTIPGDIHCRKGKRIRKTYARTTWEGSRT